MDERTRRQLLELSRDFYEAHASGFDASRGHQPWPGWERLVLALALPSGSVDGEREDLRVLDVGCGNARLAKFLGDALAGSTQRLRYTGVDANATLLRAAKERLGENASRDIELVEADFLSSPTPGCDLPPGPFHCVALFGVLHHVPGRDWRRALVHALAERTRPGGLIALAAWQFAGRARFARRTVEWKSLGPVLGAKIDETKLEAGDALLRFGADPSTPPRYCHQVDDDELDALAREVAELRPGVAWTLEVVDDYRADGAEGDLNRYQILRRSD